MSLRSEFQRMLDIAESFVQKPRLLNQLPNVRRGFHHSENWTSATPGNAAPLLPGPGSADRFLKPLAGIF